MGRIFATFPRQDAQAYAHVSLEEWLASKVSRPEVRQLFVALVRLATYTNDPARVSAGLVIAQLQMALKGVLYLDRGWQTLVDGLRTMAEEAGAVIETSAPVAAIEDRGATKTIKLDGGAS